jgi:hypothetical protein
LIVTEEPMIDRRGFMGAVGGAVAATAAQPISLDAQRSATSGGGTAKMRVGTQHGDSDPILRAMAGFGVNNICSRLPSERLDERWSVEGLTRLREHVESFGITLDMVPLPMSSNEISRFEMPNIMLGKSPERDREIDDICQMIRNASRAGIPALKYNLTFIGVVRTESTKGRGGATYSTFVYDRAKPREPLTVAGRVTADEYWQRITYFLERVVPDRGGTQGPAGLSPTGSGDATRPRLSGDRNRAGHRRRTEAVRVDRRQSVSRFELLPGHRRRNARAAGEQITT